MFYVHWLVSKRGPLAKIWLAAHWEKKLTKSHVFECNLEVTVAKILSPKFAIALRTSGHLLLGVVRIYHRKTKYLLADCNEALTKMKTAFRPGLDLPEEIFEATYQAITLPEEFNDFETPLPDLNAIDVADHFTLNQSRAEDITLTEDYGSNMLLCDRTLDKEPDALRKKSFLDSSIATSRNSPDHNSARVSRDKSALQGDTFCLEEDLFGDEEEDVDMIEILLRDERSSLHKDLLDLEEEHPLSEDLPGNSTAVEFNCADATAEEVGHLTNEMTFLSKEEEFVLEPLDDSVVNQMRRNKRKRKLLVDAVKEISSNAIYNQLNNCTDILATLDLAPPTKKTMMWKELGGVRSLLSHAAQPVVHAELQKLFAKRFKSRSFKMRRNGIEAESEMEKTRREQDTTDMLIEPRYLQESAPSKAGRRLKDDSFVLTPENARNEATDNCGENMQDGAAPSENSSLPSWSLGQEAEAPQAELTNELKRSEKDREELKWTRRTLQLLKTLQHLRSSGRHSFSFRELCWKNSRKEAASKFYIVLVLKKQSVIELSQSAPFADITATVGPAFDAH